MHTIRVLAIVGVSVFTPFALRAQEIPDEQTAIARLQQLGGQIISARPMLASVTVEPVPRLVVPYWAIVIPLALLSAYLLLSKPRTAKLDQRPA